MPLRPSWVDSANARDTDFPLNNLPCGAFLSESGEPHCGVAIGDMILDVTAAEQAGAVAVPDEEEVFFFGDWTEFMALGPAVWAGFRETLTALLAADAEDPEALLPFMVPQAGTPMVLPFRVAEFTDFYASLHHASNVGTLFRGSENALRGQLAVDPHRL